MPHLILEQCQYLLVLITDMNPIGRHSKNQTCSKKNKNMSKVTTLISLVMHQPLPQHKALRLHIFKMLQNTQRSGNLADNFKSLVARRCH